MKSKYKKLYKEKYSDLLKQRGCLIEESQSHINKQNLEICFLNSKIEALIKTNLAIDCFAKDFVSSLIKYNRNSDRVKEKKALLVDIFSALEFEDKPIKNIIEEAIQYHLHTFVNDNHSIATSISHDFFIKGENIFGLKKVIVVALQYLLKCSPLGTNFKLTINGNKFANLSIEIVEQDTFVFLEDQQITNKLQTTEKFTDLFCLSWEKLLELSKNEKFYLHRKYENKNRYIFITTSSDMKILNKEYQKDNVYQIYQ